MRASIDDTFASLPPNAELAPEWDAGIASIRRPASQSRIKALMERGFHKAGEVENRLGYLGYYVGQLGSGDPEDLEQRSG